MNKTADERRREKELEDARKAGLGELGGVACARVCVRVCARVRVRVLVRVRVRVRARVRVRVRARVRVRVRARVHVRVRVSACARSCIRVPLRRGDCVHARVCMRAACPCAHMQVER